MTPALQELWQWGFQFDGRALVVSAHRERLAQPYLAGVRAADAASARGPGDVEVHAAPGLQGLEDPPRRYDEIAVALGRPELQITPAWVAGELGRDQVALWHHAPSATRGLATRRFTLPFPAAAPPVFLHFRMRAARGSGASFLEYERGKEFVSTAPGPDGLDGVAARLVQLGATVERHDGDDWG